MTCVRDRCSRTGAVSRTASHQSVAEWASRGYGEDLTFRALFLCFALALALAAPAGAQLPAGQRTIAVVGNASVTAPNDTATVSFGVVTRHGTATGALTDTSARTRRVIDALAGQGIAKADIQTQTVGLGRTVRRTGKHRRKRRVVYTASNSVDVTVHDLSKTGAVIQAAVDAGATRVSGVEFSASNSEGLYDQALGLAYDNARSKATALAARAGMTLGDPISTQEGQQDVCAVPDEAQPAPAAGPPPIEPGTATVTAIVTVVFAMS